MQENVRDGNRSLLRAWYGLGVVVMALVVMGVSLPAVADSGRVKKRDSRIEFTHDLDGALEQAKNGGLPVYLAFGAVWCPVCRRMEDVTLLEPPMQALAGDFIWVRVDIDRNISLAREWGVEATPTIFLLDPDGRSRRRIVGGARIFLSIRRTAIRRYPSREVRRAEYLPATCS